MRDNAYVQTLLVLSKTNNAMREKIAAAGDVALPWTDTSRTIKTDFVQEGVGNRLRVARYAEPEYMLPGDFSSRSMQDQVNFLRANAPEGSPFAQRLRPYDFKERFNPRNWFGQKPMFNRSEWDELMGNKSEFLDLRDKRTGKNIGPLPEGYGGASRSAYTADMLRRMGVDDDKILQVIGGDAIPDSPFGGMRGANVNSVTGVGGAGMRGVAGANVNSVTGVGGAGMRGVAGAAGDAAGDFGRIVPNNPNAFNRAVSNHGGSVLRYGLPIAGLAGVGLIGKGIWNSFRESPPEQEYNATQGFTKGEAPWSKNI